MTVFHAETVRNRAELRKAEPFIQVAGVGVAFNDRIELQDSKSAQRSTSDTITHEFFADVLTAIVRRDRVACVCNVRTAADIVRVQNVQADDRSVLVLGDG